MREDHFTNTPEDAGRYEEMRAETDAAADRPTLAEANRDECPTYDDWDLDECLHLHQIIEGDDMGWTCTDCGRFVTL